MTNFALYTFHARQLNMHDSLLIVHICCYIQMIWRLLARTIIEIDGAESLPCFYFSSYHWRASESFSESHRQSQDPLRCTYPSLGCFPVTRALKFGQLKRLYFPRLSNRPLEDSESTTQHDLVERAKSEHKPNRVRFDWTYQNSFWHVLPKNKLGLASCTVGGIFWTERAAAKTNQ